jgi:putative tricarboxylic transport membrane protein
LLLTRIGSPKDFWAGILFMMVGLVVIFVALGYPMGSAGRMGPGYFPRVLGAILMVLGFLTVIRGVTTQGVPFGGWPWRYFLLILGSVVVFAFALPKLGLAFSSFILVALSGFAAPEGKTWQIIAYAAALSLTASCVFVYALGLEIPLWPWSP